MRFPALVPLVASVVLAGCGDQHIRSDGHVSSAPRTAGEGEGEGEGGFDFDLLDDLSALDGVTATELRAENPGTRAFELDVVQPVDHDDPAGATFVQRVFLVHTDPSAPMVLTTTGYGAFDEYTQYLEEITLLLGGNQVLVEERFFGPSTPAGDDWSKLTIAQAAADHHHVEELLLPLYPGAWVATGHSKGGMTSVYHERFFPEDLAAVVAYVAPISFGAPDARYAPWLADIGDPDCREAIRDEQRQGAAQLDGVVDLLEAEGSGLSRAVLENFAKSSISTFEWGFWQFYSVCDGSYDGYALSTPEDVQFFFGITTLRDPAEYRQFDAYTYQSRSQLGYPDQYAHHLDDTFGAIDDRALDLVVGDGPWAVDPVYDGGAAMNDVADFVSQSGERLLFVYGGVDPWSGGEFTLGGAEDSFLLTAPGANHFAYIADLASADANTAVDALERWTGVTIDATFALSPARAAAIERLRARDRDVALRAWRSIVP